MPDVSKATRYWYSSLYYSFPGFCKNEDIQIRFNRFVIFCKRSAFIILFNYYYYGFLYSSQDNLRKPPPPKKNTLNKK